MKSLLKLLPATLFVCTLNAEATSSSPTINASKNEKSWGGFYSKLSFGYGEPDIQFAIDGKSEKLIDTSKVSAILTKTSVSARLVGYDYRLSNSFAAGFK